GPVVENKIELCGKGKHCCCCMVRRLLFLKLFDGKKLGSFCRVLCALLSTVEQQQRFPFPCNSIAFSTTGLALGEQLFTQTIALSRQTKYFSRHRVLLVEQARDRPQKIFLKPIWLIRGWQHEVLYRFS
ncbi:MAG: hypothetical protein AAF773_26710, partial [Cyanobacteria bacterium P01_D01_bin.115]